MKRQVYNPFLPIDTYIPDGEPHVFGDRVYLFGSHDKEGGKSFCMLGYEIWSAPINDLSDWSSKGINYEASQDPLFSEKKEPYLYAPDCVRGNDGRFYLYYCFGGYTGPISVAVCDTPDGKYEFYGHVKNADGSYLKSFVPFDPAVINDEGTIRLYYGTWYPFDELPEPLRQQTLPVQMQMFGKTKEEIAKDKDGIFGPVACVLEDDMLKIKQKPVRIFPAKTLGTPFESNFVPNAGEGEPKMCGHGFFEGSSIRKIGNKYYFIYSSVNNHELCYATSNFPDREFCYQGCIISNGDVGYEGRKPSDRLNHTGTNHGSIEKIGEHWYVFYHRQTHGTDYSRQACAEMIEIMPNGSIPQVEITSCGLNGKPLRGKGNYPAVICCNLTNGNMPHGGNQSYQNIPIVTHDTYDRYLTGLSQGVTVGYKYFDLRKTNGIDLVARGKGKMSIMYGTSVQAEIEVQSDTWKKYEVKVKVGKGKEFLNFYITEGSIEILSFECKE